METLERWLKAWPLALALLFAAAISFALSSNGVVSEGMMPFGDSEHYILHAMTVDGFLHTGQWSRAWETFTAQGQTLAPPHYWIFFLLPARFASLTAYGVTQVVTTYGLLALGIWMLCRALDRVEWTPALFLFCAVQNISLDHSYFYFADMPFLALGTIALAWQVRAWRSFASSTSVLSGVGAGLMFWVKAPNAIIFAGTWLVAEIIHAVWMRRDVSTRQNLVRHALAVLAGLIPVALLALACGAAEAIVRLVDTNEVSGLFATQLTCTGLFRLFYFPLSLTFFYHAVAMAVIFTVVGIAAYKISQASPIAPTIRAAFATSLLTPLIIAYVLLGFFFSFGIAFKSMRFLLMIVPVLWLGIFWVLERWRVRPGLLLLAACAYAFCGFTQVLTGSFESQNVSSESYQLEGDWLTRLPMYNAIDQQMVGMTKSLLGMMQQALPEGGKIAVGTEALYVTSESLTWTSQHDLALRGQVSPFEFANFLTFDGKVCRSSLRGARGMLVMVDPALQYSKANYEAAGNLIHFCAQHWFKDGVVQMVPIGNGEGKMAGAIIVMKEPLTDARIDELIAGMNAQELPPGTDFGASVVRRLSWAECADILKRWAAKRLGYGLQR